MHRGPVLVDTVTMLEGVRTGSWNALKGAYALETVEVCLAEFMTGPKSPARDNPMFAAAFQKNLTAHLVSPLALAEAALRPGPALDPGELALWAHAMNRQDAWVICGPDRASMRWGFENGWRDRLTSLGRLLADIRHRPNPPLKGHHEQAWLDDVLNKLVNGVL